MKKLLFVRTFARPTGGNVNVQTLFRHAVAYPRLDVRVWFAPGSRHAQSDLWNGVAADRVVDEPRWDDADFVVVNGKDWRLLPPSGRFRVIHLVQHLGYADDDELRGYLGRRAVRICISDAAAASIRPHADGPIVVIPSGVDGALFRDDGTRRPGSVLIWAGDKAPELGAAIRARLADAGVAADVIVDWLPRAEFAARLRGAGVFVGLPLAREGFYRPALEAMACGCAVVCSDALGNRAHCIDGETCLQPPHGDAAAHAAAVLRLCADAELRERISAGGTAIARRFDLARERERVHALFDDLLRSA